MFEVSAGNVTVTGPSTFKFNWTDKGSAVELNSFTGTRNSSPGATNRGQFASSRRGDVTVTAWSVEPYLSPSTTTAMKRSSPVNWGSWKSKRA